MGWRPPQAIRVKVLGLATDGDRHLFAEVERSDGSIAGLRPLGGSVEFGETLEAALIREFREELGVEIRIAGAWHVLENIFVHEGAMGHEFVFVARIASEDLPKGDRDGRFPFDEGGSRCTARWTSLATAHANALAIFPTGLAALLARIPADPRT